MRCMRQKSVRLPREISPDAKRRRSFLSTHLIEIDQRLLHHGRFVLFWCFSQAGICVLSMVGVLLWRGRTVSRWFASCLLFTLHCRLFVDSREHIRLAGINPGRRLISHGVIISSWWTVLVQIALHHLHWLGGCQASDFETFRHLGLTGKLRISVLVFQGS